MKPVYLRPRREWLNLSQSQLSRQSGVAQNTISKLERLVPMRTSYAIVKALAKTLGVEPASLRFGPKPRKRPSPSSKRAAA